jgi:hypothetical protein
MGKKTVGSCVGVQHAVRCRTHQVYLRMLQNSTACEEWRFLGCYAVWLL